VSLCFGWTHKRLNAGLCINNYTLFLCMCLWHFHEPSVFADCHCHLLALIWLLAYATPSPVSLFVLLKNLIFLFFYFKLIFLILLKLIFKKIILIHFQIKNTLKIIVVTLSNTSLICCACWEMFFFFFMILHVLRVLVYALVIIRE
jgi:hypothetical protein